MSMNLRHAARRPKESHRDTVSYEIEMLRFCFEMLKNGNCAEQSEYLYLEGFLLHYRNLIEFFSGEHHKDNKDHTFDDLSMAVLITWASREPSHSELTAIRVPATTLDSGYYKQISKYLQHCTLARSERDRDWNVELMMKQIVPIIAEFERRFPRAESY